MADQGMAGLRAKHKEQSVAGCTQLAAAAVLTWKRCLYRNGHGGLGGEKECHVCMLVDDRVAQLAAMQCSVSFYAA